MIGQYKKELNNQFFSFVINIASPKPKNLYLLLIQKETTTLMKIKKL